MKVILLNGSPHAQGCTATMLGVIAQTMENQGIETEMIHVGGNTSGCKGCFACHRLGRCVQQDELNDVAERLAQAQGMVIASPVYFASPAGSMIAFLDRLYAAYGHQLIHKPCGCFVTARRAGTTAALDALNKYPLINEQPLVASQYWCMAHGNTPNEVLADAEGVEIARTLGRNMAWLVKALQNAPHPD